MLAVLEGYKVSLSVCMGVCVDVSTPVLLCNVLGKAVKSWQALSTPGQALPAALTVKTMNSLFVPAYEKTEQKHLFGNYAILFTLDPLRSLTDIHVLHR